MARRAAIIGSFKKHYPMVLEALHTFHANGIEVTSPLGTEILVPEIDFVRFKSDDPSYTDAAVQSATLQRIFSADFTFVVAPEGYVGKTTCYEIGRLLEAREPVYFSSHPVDLPVHIPGSHVMPAQELCTLSSNPSWSPSWPFSACQTQSSAIERDLSTSR